MNRFLVLVVVLASCKHEGRSYLGKFDEVRKGPLGSCYGSDGAWMPLYDPITSVFQCTFATQAIDEHDVIQGMAGCPCDGSAVAHREGADGAEVTSIDVTLEHCSHRTVAYHVDEMLRELVGENQRAALDHDVEKLGSDGAMYITGAHVYGELEVSFTWTRDAYRIPQAKPTSAVDAVDAAAHLDTLPQTETLQISARPRGSDVDHVDVSFDAHVTAAPYCP